MLDGDETGIGNHRFPEIMSLRAVFPVLLPVKTGLEKWNWGTVLGIQKWSFALNQD